MRLFKHLLFAIGLCGLLQNAHGHGHINAGAKDTNLSGSINMGDKLFMYFEPGTETTVLDYNSGLGTYGDDGNLWNGYTTFTALHQSSFPGEAPNYNSVGALSGSYLVLNIGSISGPDGATFSFYDAGATTPTWTYQIGTGLISGTGSIVLTEDSWFNDDPSNPYGHIHGRMFAVDTPGIFTVSWILHDINSSATGMLDSDVFTSSFTAVPEPSSWALVGISVTGLAACHWFRSQRLRPS